MGKSKKDKKCSPCKKYYTLPITFDLWNSEFVPQNKPFTVNLQFIKDDCEVTVTFPAMNWQQTGSPPPFAPGGYLYTQAGFLPEKLRPRNILPTTTTLETNLVANVTGLDVQIRQDGNIVITNKDNTTIPVGPVSTYEKTYTYIVNKLCWKIPQNFALSSGFSQASYGTGSLVSGQFREYYENSFQNGKFVSLWADNSTLSVVPGVSNQLNTYVRTGQITGEKCSKLNYQLNNVNPAIVTGPGITTSEGSISINPTNPNNIVIVINYFDNNLLPPSVNRFQALCAFSIDAGITWTVNRIDSFTNPGLFPGTTGDLNGKFDRFGNFWVSYQNSPTLAPPFSIIVAVSPSDVFNNAGASFSLVKIFSLDPARPPGGYDYPAITTGGDGNGGWATYISARSSPGPRILYLGYVLVTGPGLININGGVLPLPSTPLVPFPTLVFPTGLMIPTPVVSDDGKIFIITSYKFNPTGFNRQDLLALAYKPDGVNNFNNPNIQGLFLTSQLNLSPGDGAVPPWQANRGLLIVPLGGIDYDNQHKILYQSWLDVDYAEYSRSNVKNIYFAFSQNNGRTWSPRFQINDSGVNTRGIQAMSVDQTNGNLYFSWYDARNSPLGPDGAAGKFVEYFATLVPFSRIEPYLNQVCEETHVDLSCYASFVKKSDNRHEEVESDYSGSGAAAAAATAEVSVIAPEVSAIAPEVSAIAPEV